jgi:hypothetical protein
MSKQTPLRRNELDWQGRGMDKSAIDIPFFWKFLMGKKEETENQMRNKIPQKRYCMEVV